MVFSSLGTTTFSSALTQLLVTFDGCVQRQERRRLQRRQLHQRILGAGVRRAAHAAVSEILLEAWSASASDSDAARMVSPMFSFWPTRCV
jgi:hypothetical protein